MLTSHLLILRLVFLRLVIVGGEKSGTSSTAIPTRTTSAKGSKSKREPVHFSLDDVLTEHPASREDFDPYEHGPAHGVVHYAVKRTSTSKDLIERGKTEKNYFGKNLVAEEDKEYAIRIGRVIEELEAECGSRRIGLTLGEQKGQALEDASAERLHVEQALRLESVLPVAANQKDSSISNTKSEETSTTIITNTTCLDENWDFNILEFGSHIGDGTLRLLRPLVERLFTSSSAGRDTSFPTAAAKQSTSSKSDLQRKVKIIAKNTFPNRVNVLSTEENMSWQTEGAKLVRHALNFEDPGKTFPTCSSLTLEKGRSKGKNAQRPLADFVHYSALHFSGEEDFQSIVPALQSHVDGGRFDIVMLDHEYPERFVDDVEDLVFADALNDGCLVIVDNMLRKADTLEPLRRYLEHGSGFMADLKKQDKKARWWFADREVVEIHVPYRDRLWINKFDRQAWIKLRETYETSGKKRRRRGGHDEL
ncbi:unnamed protein product [Amoebophrya sp. A25]|nr:unnamed protein product [Amoebophrya sp. A25]|eukprot:GSA25T00000135001.1